VEPTALATTDRGAGVPIVLIPGLTFARQVWDPIADRLVDRHRVVTVDLPGQGDSEGSGADPAAVVSRLHATLTGLDVDAPWVVGHSAGAVLATGYAAAWPVRGVINVDQPLVMSPFAAFVQQQADELRGPAFDAAFAPFEQSIGCDSLPQPERDRVQALRRIQQDLVLDHWDWPLTTDPAELQRRVDALLEAISAPYVYVAAGEPPEQVRGHLLAHVRSARLATLPGGGHVAHLAHPREFAELVARVVDEAGG
jgi:2-succinyl-6-hydroxy-2,4-cyclohexadiene-1-carboxylate synthase